MKNAVLTANRPIFLIFAILALAAPLAVPRLQAQELPRIAVYTTGSVPENEKSALGTRLLTSLINSGLYRGIERSSAFLAEIDREQEKQRSGAIDDNQISALGKQFGVEFVCIANINPVFGGFQVSARIVNVETAEIIYIGESASSLRNINDLGRVSDQVVKNMFTRSGRPARVPAQKPAATAQEPAAPDAEPAAPDPEPVALAPEPVAPAPEPAPAPRAESPAQPEPAPPPLPVEQTMARMRAQESEPAKKSKPPRQEPAPKPAKQPKPPAPKPGPRMSAGVGVLYVNEVGGIQWEGSKGQLAMPRSGIGAHLFFDAAYAELSAALAAPGGKWESQSISSGNTYDMQSTSVTVAALAKYPVALGPLSLFPLIGAEYEASISAKIVHKDRNDKSERKLGGKDEGLSAIWVKLGGGADINMGDNLYARAELLYGARTANALEKSGGDGAKPYLGQGVTGRVGVGYRF